MAKAIGFIGGIHGKSGNVVFRKGENGMTIMSAYQPQVSNPKTSAQVAQRARMNAVGRFSRLWSANDLSPLSGTRLRNRSQFNSNCLLNSRYYPSDSKAAVVPELVKFSNGVLPVASSLVVSGENITGSRINVQVPMGVGITDRIIRVYCAFQPTAEDDNPARAEVHTFNYDSSNPSHEFRINLSTPDNAETDSRWHFWIVESVPQDEGGRQTYQRLQGADNDQINATFEDAASTSAAYTYTSYQGSYKVGKEVINP